MNEYWKEGGVIVKKIAGNQGENINRGNMENLIKLFKRLDISNWFKSVANKYCEDDEAKDIGVHLFVYCHTSNF